MRWFQFGLMVVITVAALLSAALWGMAHAAAPAQGAPVSSPAPVEASSVQAVGLSITTTVGINQAECATTNRVQVRAGTTVYYCFTLRHTGVSGDESLTIHNIQSSRGLNRPISPLKLDPGQTTTTVLAGFFITDSSTVDVTNFFTWTARPEDNEPLVIATSRAQIDVTTPSVQVVKTVGNDGTNCGSTQVLNIPSNTSAFFCISINNTGDITITNHTINDPLVGISNASFTRDLRPGGSFVIVNSNMAQFGITSGSLERRNVTSAIANVVNYTGSGVNGISVSGTSTATVNIGTTTATLVKAVGTRPEDCGASPSITVPPGTRVYYCAVITNTGGVTLTHHKLFEEYLSIDLSFDYVLRPGQMFTVTNDFLARNNLPIVFGPFEVHPRFGTNNVVGNEMRYTGTSDDGFSAIATSKATVTYPPTPTPTFTSRPEATSTSTPPFPVTPTFTPIPPTPTPTLTPTFTPVTPSPTPTRSYAISLLETPTPRAQSAGLPVDPQQQPFAETPTVDPNLLAQQPPVQDPIVATATQLAVDATATQIAVDATAVAAAATAAQLSIESAQATALAETQAGLPPTPFFDSPLATPTVDPAIAGDGGSAGLPVVPGFETATVTPTLLPTDTLVPEGGAPGADVTVLPAPVTVVVTSVVTATETPAVLVVVVTATPEPGAVPGAFLADGQRPIVYPTATPTPDFVMAAARTFDVAVTTMGWLWFLVGSLIFFVTAGVVAGLFFRQSEANRFELPDPDYWLEEEPTADRSGAAPKTGQRPDEEWPADLP